MKVFITKYALSKGILEREVEPTEVSPDMVADTSAAWRDYFHRGEWFRTKAEAEARVREMVTAKLKSLDKQREKVAKVGRALGMDV